MSPARKRKLLASTLVSCAVALGVWLPSGRTAGQPRTAAAGQGKDKSVSYLSHGNEPVEVTDLKLKGISRAFGQKFSDEGDDWFRGLKIRVKNRSGKSIVYLQVSMLLDRPDDPDSRHNKPFSFYLRFGRDPREVGGAGPASAEPVPHGAARDLGLSEGDYERLQRHFRSLGHTTKVKDIRLVLGMVAFDDGTAWAGGRWFERNHDKEPDDPDGYIPMSQPTGSAGNGTAYC